MILYLSGNFPQLSDPVKEKAMAERTIKMGYDYHRLITFYYQKDCNTVINIVKELKGGKHAGKT